MMIGTDAVDVQIRHKLTQNVPHNDLFIEVNDLQGNLVAAFNTPSHAAVWLYENNFQYVEGSSGVWTRKKDSFINISFLDGRTIASRQLYRRRSIFTLDTITLALTVALCAAVYVVLG
jgi:phosphoserine aminotransferase